MPLAAGLCWLAVLVGWGAAAAGEVPGGVPGAELCWQAVLRCQGERQCRWAYGQYSAACEPLVRGQSSSQCPSHCIGALLQLNRTEGGPGLETCDCGSDPQCRRLKRAIEPCLPRPHRQPSLGCTEARRRCEARPPCRTALRGYLAACGQLFNGRRCGTRCRAAIQRLLALPGGARLDACVCDGPDRAFCQVVKGNMRRFCSLGTAHPLLPTHSPRQGDHTNLTQPRGGSGGGQGGHTRPLNVCAGLGAQTWGSPLLLLSLLPLLSLLLSLLGCCLPQHLVQTCAF
ncbi:growth arrest-specific protein 1-like [Scyliorhinus canicula]|uniref:growth arrest-specific protein 1-like n=1 Tax=Scyliorhinus canicula TaxID=7830 RepID=UPI0018F33027|nr:growth arrest-specific protein 1-like [Scyliorhinus canicula]